MEVLIVDDEQDIGLLMSKVLMKAGLDVVYRSNLQDAQIAVKENHFDIYFLDLNLPDGSGFDLIPVIRAVNSNARIIIFSAHDGITELKRASELGVHDFIKKPFNKDTILNALN
ncbi:MAG: response regulator [Bacteroidia bacterium]